MNYSYAIIDHDIASSIQLQGYMQNYIDFEYIGSTTEPNHALDLIVKKSPDLVVVNFTKNPSLLFQMIMQLHQYVDKIPLLIGVSESKKFAYDAIKAGFFDYWLLPHNEFEIRRSMLRLKKQLPKGQEPPTLCLKTYNDYHYLDTDDILYLKADNNSTDFFMKNGRKISAYKTLKTFEELLPSHFIRVHQSYILNSNYISRINYGKNTCSLQNNDGQIPFSRTYRDKVDKLKTSLSKKAINTLT